MWHEASNLPDFARKDPIAYFSAAEKYETRTAYEEWKFTVPRELSRPQQMEAARDFLEASFSTSHPYVWALHDARAADGGRNVHVHVIWSGRTLDTHERSPEQFFRRHNAAHPERGGAKKSPTFSHMGSVRAFRVMHTDIMNLHLEHAGLEVRLHPDKLSERGFDRTPEPRLRIKDSNAYKRGIITPRMQEVLEHRQARAPHIEAEQRQARIAWMERKFNLGISRGMELDEAIGRIHEARMYAVTHGPDREAERAQRTQEIQALEQSLSRDMDLDRHWDRPLIGNSQSRIYHTPEQKNYGDIVPQHQVWFWTEREAQDAGYRRAMNDHYGRGTGQAMADRERTQSAQQRPERAVGAPQRARLLDLGLATQDPEQGHGHAVRARVFGRDREREGRSYDRS